MTLRRLDACGRIVLPKQYRLALGLRDNVLLINAGDHLRLMSVSDDPVEALRGVFTSKKSFYELRLRAEAEAQKEIKNRWCTSRR